MKAEKGNTITLRIKKKYFDQIVEGTKKVEYRKINPYYIKLLKRTGLRYLKLHYQAPRQAIIKIKKIKTGRTPKASRGPNFGKSRFEIHLQGKAKVFRAN